MQEHAKIGAWQELAPVWYEVRSGLLQREGQLLRLAIR